MGLLSTKSALGHTHACTWAARGKQLYVAWQLVTWHEQRSSAWLSSSADRSQRVQCVRPQWGLRCLLRLLCSSLLGPCQVPQPVDSTLALLPAAGHAEQSQQVPSLTACVAMEKPREQRRPPGGRTRPGLGSERVDCSRLRQTLAAAAPMAHGLAAPLLCSKSAL